MPTQTDNWGKKHVRLQLYNLSAPLPSPPLLSPAVLVLLLPVPLLTMLAPPLSVLFVVVSISTREPSPILVTIRPPSKQLVVEVLAPRLALSLLVVTLAGNNGNVVRHGQFSWNTHIPQGFNFPTWFLFGHKYFNPVAPIMCQYDAWAQ